MQIQLITIIRFPLINLCLAASLLGIALAPLAGSVPGSSSTKRLVELTASSAKALSYLLVARAAAASSRA